ncbi:MAG: 50S ribosomal protein L29 [Gammaproteobacteria bacterium]
MMQANELRKKRADELLSLLLDLRRELFNLRMQKGAGQTVRPARLQGARREIARVKTVLHEMRQGESA